ncbi:MAG: peptide ABC transporter substrate-binding protein [Planctomycetota bacterium]
MIRTVRVAVLALACCLLVSCGFDSAPADLTIAHDSEPPSLDPALMTGVGEGRIATALFEGLTSLDSKTLEVRPGVAEEWEVSPGGLEWRFTLREDARWSDGNPLTAQDFRWSWLRVLDPVTGAPYAGLLYPVHGAEAFHKGEGPRSDVAIRADDDRTLIVTLDRPIPWFGSLTAFFTLLPVPRAAVEAHGDRWTRPEHIVTNGPFHLEDWRFYREILLRRSATYRGPGPAKAERIRLLPVPDANTQLNLYATGVVDVTFSVPSSVVGRLSGRADFVSGPRLATVFVRMNVRRAPLDSVKIRRAISHAIDQPAIVRHVTRGGEEEAFSLTPPSIRPWRVEEAMPTTRAIESRPLSLLLPENPDYAALATVLANQWKERLGLEIRLDIREWKVYLASRRRGDYDLALSTWIGDYPDATTFLDCFRSGDGNNQTGWASEDYDAHLAAAASTGADRDGWLGKAETLLLREAPIAPIYHPTLRYLVSPRVKGFATNALGLVRFADLSVGEGER